MALWVHKNLIFIYIAGSQVVRIGSKKSESIILNLKIRPVPGTYPPGSLGDLELKYIPFNCSYFSQKGGKKEKKKKR